MRSNFSVRVHQKGNRSRIRWGARSAAARCERPKGKTQRRREAAIKRKNKKEKRKN